MCWWQASYSKETKLVDGGEVWWWEGGSFKLHSRDVESEMPPTIPIQPLSSESTKAAASIDKAGIIDGLIIW